ncbi:MAG: hypothetical protein HY205_04530 [Nitrospirae bacterium]|mgnify:FL=1|nr:hypothetical protein [Nitrospirota bacterium]
MVLVYENEPLDNQDARGHFYHVCQGRIEQASLPIPAPDKPYECPQCGIELETEDFWVAQLKGSV